MGNIKKKIGLAVITKNVDSLSPYLDFIENGLRHGYKINELIVVYSHYKDQVFSHELKTILAQHTITVHLVQAVNDPFLEERLLRKGVSEATVNSLLFTPLLKEYNLIPYGHYRNVAMLTGLVLNIDYLFFIDTDVSPYLLVRGGKSICFKEINFFGEHLRYLKRDEVIITSSDYSGYYIIPSFSFIGLKKLLVGLQKESAYSFIKESNDCLILAPTRRNIRLTDKLLGGNMAIDMKYFKEFPPFFSTTYLFRRQIYLGRGEDTLLGRAIWEKGLKAFDIDLKIFHDTYNSLLWSPVMNSKTVRDRFYFACMGWLGRNPFLNWLDFKEGKTTKKNFKKRQKRQYINLLQGSISLADYLEDKRFLDLSEAFLMAYRQLDNMIEEYYKIKKAWKEVQTKFCKKGSEVDAPTSS